MLANPEETMAQLHNLNKVRDELKDENVLSDQVREYLLKMVEGQIKQIEQIANINKDDVCPDYVYRKLPEIKFL